MSNVSSKPVSTPDTQNIEDGSVSNLKASIPNVPWKPWLGFIFIVVIFYSSQLFSSLIISLYPWIQHWSTVQANAWLNNSVPAQFVYVLIAETYSIGLIYLFLKRYKTNFSIIGLRKPRWRDVGYGLLAVPVYYAFYLLTVVVVSHFVPSLNINQHQNVGFNDVHGLAMLLMTFISLVILPPIAEEIMVRGFLYSSLRKGLPQIMAAILTSLIFASAHLPEGGAAGPLYIAALDTFVLSLVLIYLRNRTGSLWASITLHGFKNGIAFVAIFILNTR